MPRKTTVPIYDGDDFERLGELRRLVAVEERNASLEATRLGDGKPEALIEAEAAYNAFLDEAAERAEEWVIETIGNAEWRKLIADHPPRKVTGPDGKERTHEDDEGIEVNTETFPLALLTFVDAEDPEIRTITAPEFDSPAALRRRLKRLSQGEFETLWSRAYALNTGGVADPKLARFSTAPTSSET